MKDEYKELYTYCALSESKNIVAIIESEDINKWKSDYIDLLKKNKNPSCIYRDPDQTYKEGDNHRFFCQLVLFLNKRENELVENLKGKYVYKFVEGKGIEVSETDQEGKEIALFYLRSDQFGFSAPSNKKSHPYDLYIKKSKDKAIEKSENMVDAEEQVANWIIASRTIGGSFLWPLEKNKDGSWKGQPAYNLTRGRGKMQDRVDLTLLDIRNCFCGVAGSWLLSQFNNCENMKKWLGHFGKDEEGFSQYIEFFKFNAFIEDSFPKDLLSKDNIIEDFNLPQHGEKFKDYDSDKLEKVLTNLNNRILERSKAIEEIIKSA